MRACLVAAAGLLLTGCFSDPSVAGVAQTEDGGASDTSETGETGEPDDSTTTAMDTTSAADLSSSGEPEDGSGSTSSGGPECGNSQVEPGEMCDGKDPPGAACLDDCTFTCLGDFESCDRLPVSGCEIDTANDPNNCGGCGDVCPSGVCIEGACGAATVAEGIGFGPTRIARVGDSFIFDESGFGRILRWDLGAKDALELVPDAQTGVFRGFAVADGSAYWLDANNGTAMQVGLDGGNPVFMFALDDAGSPHASATHLFYPTTTFVDLQQVSNLLWAPREDPSAASTFAADIPGKMCQVVQAANRIVWTTTSTELPFQSLAADGSGSPNFLPVFPADACNRPVYAVGPAIYFYGSAIEDGPRGLVRFNLPGGATSLLIEEPSFDAFGDYFVSADGIVMDVEDEVRLYDAAGENPIVIGESTTGAIGRYVDEDFVLWTEVSENTWTLFLTATPN